MRILKNLFGSICTSRKKNKNTASRLVPVISLLLCSVTTLSQPKLRPLHVKDTARRALVTTHFQDPARSPTTAKTADIKTESDQPSTVKSKTVLKYANKILAIDTASYKRIQLISKLTNPQAEFKIIPERHVETSALITEAYRIVFTLLQPFEYNDSSKKFNATMGFFLMPESGNSNATVAEPVDVEVVSNDIPSIRPDHLKIERLNLPSSKVELAAVQVSDSVGIKVITSSNPDGYLTFLKVKPTLEVFTNRTSLQGYGIQKIPVEVRFIGSSSPDSVLVNFSIGKGTVYPNAAYVSYNKPSTIYISSEGTGDAKLSASTNNIQSNDLHFSYTFPWPFLLFSIIGGLLGGLAKHYFTRRGQKNPTKPIIGGIIVGFIIAVAYYFLGVNLLKLRIVAELNEIAVLGLSALGAYFGISVLKLDSKEKKDSNT